MTVVVWIAEHTWPACVDAARSLAPAGSEIALLTVVDRDTADAAHGAFTGMLGRAAVDPAPRVSAAADEAADALLEAAAARLGRPARRLLRHGRAEHEVVSAAAEATMLIVSREATAPGPKSLGKAVRFVVDHAPCPVLLIWPGPPPSPPETPPPPPRGRPRPRPPHPHAAGPADRTSEDHEHTIG